MRFGRTNWVFLNSSRVVLELLEKRASIYSSRPNLVMAHQLISDGKRILLMPYGDLWRRERKIMHQILNVNQKAIFEPYQDLESRTLLFQYLKTPHLFGEAHARYSNSIIMSVVFGRRSKLEDPDLVELLGTAEEFVKFLIPGSSFVDMLPWLASVPCFKAWQPWRWYADDLYQRTRRYEIELCRSTWSPLGRSCPRKFLVVAYH